MVFPINDALDAILLGSFLFGILFTVGSLLLGAADIGGDSGDHSFGEHPLAELFNVTSILAFVTWFGGIGYIVRNGTGLHWLFALILAVAGGLAAGWLVRLFVVKVLRSDDQVLDPEDFRRVGTLARVSSSIRPGGVGEIVWEHRGSRMVGSARSTSDVGIARGTEVLVLQFERGIALVEPFDGLLAGDAQSSGGG